MNNGSSFLYRLAKTFAIFVLIGSFTFLFSTQVFAEDNDDITNDCQITVGGVETSISTSNVPALPNDGQTGTIFGGAAKYSFEIRVCPGDFSVLSDDLRTYRGNGEPVVANMSTTGFNFSFLGGRAHSALSPDGTGCLTGTFENAADSASDFSIDIESEDSKTPICRREHGHLSPLQRDESNSTGYEEAVSELCSSVSFSPSNPTIEDEIEIRASIPAWFFSNTGLVVTPDGRTYRLAYKFSTDRGDTVEQNEGISRENQGLAYTSFSRSYSDLSTAIYETEFYLTTSNRYDDVPLCSVSFSVGTPRNPGGRINGDPGEYAICQSNLKVDSDAFSNCISCYGSDGIWTAIGCIDQDPRGMVERFISIGTGILGGIFLLRVLAAAFMLTTSQGDVKKTSEAKEMIIEAIIGVLFVLFSVSLLQFIGSDIMQIPGFGS